MYCTTKPCYFASTVYDARVHCSSQSSYGMGTNGDWHMVPAAPEGDGAGIGAEKPLFSVLAAWVAFVYQAVVTFAVAFKLWRQLLGSVKCNWSRASAIKYWFRPEWKAA